MVSRLILRTYAGGEARLTWQTLPPPRKEVLGGSPDMTTEDVNSCKLQTKKAVTSNLVNSSDSEEARPEGIPGFGSLPRPTTFGLNARRQVKRLAAVLDGLASKPQEVIFFTGTLPGSTPRAMLALSQWSGFLAHRLKAWMHDIDSEYKCLFVWEWQKRGALHMHAAVYVKNITNRNRIYNEFKMQWIRLLESISERSGVDVFARGGGKGTWRGCYSKIRAEAEWVKKSVASYLGKYMSKAVKPGQDKSKFFYPSRWWGSTQNLKNLEKAARTEDEYFCSLPREAEAAYNGVVGLLTVCSEWSASYAHKVVRGETTVTAGTLVPLVRKLFLRGIKMRPVNENTDLYPLLNELQALSVMLQNEDSEWFAGFVNEYAVAGKYLLMTRGEDSQPPTHPDQVVMVSGSFSHMLAYSASSGRVYRTKRLHPREVMSIRSTHRRLMAAIDEYLEHKYPHTLEDVAFALRPL